MDYSALNDWRRRFVFGPSAADIERLHPKIRRYDHMKRSYLKASLWTLLLVSCLKLNTSVFGQTTSLVTVDKVHGYVGVLGGPTVFSSGVGSHTGKPADYGIDFGTGGAATSVHITNATFLNLAATND